MRKSMVIILICFTFIFGFCSNLLSVSAYTPNPDLQLGGDIDSGSVTCESIFKKNGEYNKLYYVLQDAFTFIKFLAPILVIALSIMDYIKAITSHDAEGLKKANTKFVKRLVIGILIFLLPFLLDFLFEAFGVYDLQTCGIGK